MIAMIQDLKTLTEEEVNLVYRAPLLVSVLISGADGKIDRAEINTAINFAKENSKLSRAMLYDFYSDIIKNFDRSLKDLIKEYPDDTNDRNQLISEELSGLNEIFSKVDKAFAIVFYISLKEIALKVAKSSGGVFGINSISKAEAAYVDLPMIKDPANMFI